MMTVRNDSGRLRHVHGNGATFTECFGATNIGGPSTQIVTSESAATTDSSTAAKRAKHRTKCRSKGSAHRAVDKKIGRIAK
jgi:hypothetical protein